MTILTETLGRGGFLASEANGNRSRATLTVDESQDLVAGAVVGQIKFATPTAALDGGNTGDGTITALSGGRKTQIGDYELTVIDATGNGTFEVITPDGSRLDNADGDSAYSNEHLAFTITAGGTGWAAGDAATITVTEGSLRVVELDPDATDGSQIAHGVLYGAVETGVGETLDEVVIVQEAEVVEGELTFPDGITSDQKAAALADLAAVNVVAR